MIKPESAILIVIGMMIAAPITAYVLSPSPPRQPTTVIQHADDVYLDESFDIPNRDLARHAITLMAKAKQEAMELRNGR